MTTLPYRNPDHVEDIISTLALYHSGGKNPGPCEMSKARDMLAEGIEVAALAPTLLYAWFNDWELARSALIKLLNSGDDFETLPKLNGPVKHVRVGPDEVVELFTDSGIVRSDRVLVRLLLPPPDRYTALVRFLNVNRDDATKTEAYDAVCEQFPDYRWRRFERDWPLARVANGLPPEGKPGRPPRKRARRK